MKSLTKKVQIGLLDYIYKNKDTMTYDEIAEKFNVSRWTVIKYYRVGKSLGYWGRKSKPSLAKKLLEGKYKIKKG